MTDDGTKEGKTLAQEILLVNPRRRRGRKKTARRRATRRPAARRAAPTRRRRRRNPIGPYAKRSGLGMYVANPRRRRRPARRRPTTAARRRRRYSRNPVAGMKGIVNRYVVPSLQAGAGAVLLDIAWGYVPVPPQLKTGPLRHVAKGAGAIMLGWGVGKVAGKRMGDTMALGALTVTAYNAIRELMAMYAPGITLGYYSAGANAGSDPSLGYYVSSPRLGVSQGESSPMANNEMGYYVQEGVGQQY